NGSVAAVLLILGLAVLIAPGKVPGLTIPDSPAAARAVQRMGMPAHGMTTHGHGMTMPKGAAAMPKRDAAMPKGSAMPKHAMRKPGGMTTSQRGAMAMPEHSSGTAMGPPRQAGRTALLSTTP